MNDTYCGMNGVCRARLGRLTELSIGLDGYAWRGWEVCRGRYGWCAYSDTRAIQAPSLDAMRIALVEAEK